MKPWGRWENAIFSRMFVNKMPDYAPFEFHDRMRLMHPPHFGTIVLMMKVNYQQWFIDHLPCLAVMNCLTSHPFSSRLLPSVLISFSDELIPAHSLWAALLWGTEGSLALESCWNRFKLHSLLILSLHAWYTRSLAWDTSVFSLGFVFIFDFFFVFVSLWVPRHLLFRLGD